jgi:hypothetical protein
MGRKLGIPFNLQSNLSIRRRSDFQNISHIDPYEESVDGVESVWASFPQTQVEVDFGVGADCHGAVIQIRWWL